MKINRQVNKSITKEDYFNNNGRGFDSPHIIRIDNLNIKVEVYSHNLAKLAEVESEVKKTIGDFNKFFRLESSVTEEIFKIYIFDNKADYTRLGGSNGFNLGLGNEGGMAYYRGEPDVFADMYVYQEGNGVCNLQHELTHGLTHYTTKGMPLPSVLMEGVAEFFEYHEDDNDIAHIKQDIEYILALEGENRKSLQNKGFDLNNFDLYKVLSLQYSEDGYKNHLVYTMGHTLIKYLMKDHPNIIREYVNKVSTGSFTDTKEWLQAELRQHNQPFKEWLEKAKSMDLESFKKWFNSDNDFQNDQSADVSRPSISKEDEYNTLRKEYNKLLKEHTSKLKEYNEERSEGDFRAIDDMQKINTISRELMAVKDRMDALKPSKVEKTEEAFDRSQYVSGLSTSELSAKVLDDHHIYKVIYGKMVSGEYSIQQFDKLYGKVSEKIITQPMTIAEIRAFCLEPVRDLKDMIEIACSLYKKYAKFISK